MFQTPHSSQKILPLKTISKYLQYLLITSPSNQHHDDHLKPRRHENKVENQKPSKGLVLDFLFPTGRPPAFTGKTSSPARLQVPVKYRTQRQQIQVLHTRRRHIANYLSKVSRVQRNKDEESDLPLVMSPFQNLYHKFYTQPFRMRRSINPLKQRPLVPSQSPKTTVSIRKNQTKKTYQAALQSPAYESHHSTRTAQTKQINSKILGRIQIQCGRSIRMPPANL